MRSLVCAAALVLGLTACDTGQPKIEVEPQKPPKSKPRKKMSPEELAEARRKAGFKDKDELAEETKAVMLKGEHEYVKTRLAEHRDMLKSIRGLLERAEKAAPKWPKAKDAQKAFDKFSEKYKEDAKAAGKVYKKVVENENMTGIGVQAKLVSMYRAFENFNNDLAPEIGAEEGFAKSLEDIRGQLDEIDKQLEEIEKDESLKVNEDYDPDADEKSK